MGEVVHLIRGMASAPRRSFTVTGKRRHWRVREEGWCQSATHSDPQMKTLHAPMKHTRAKPVQTHMSLAPSWEVFINSPGGKAQHSFLGQWKLGWVTRGGLLLGLHAERSFRFCGKKKNHLRTKKLSFKSWTEKPEAADKLILAAVAQKKLADVKKKKECRSGPVVLAWSLLKRSHLWILHSDLIPF